MITSIELLIEAIEIVLPNELVSDDEFENQVIAMIKSLKEDSNYYQIDSEELKTLKIDDSQIKQVLTYIEANQDRLEPDSFETIISFR